MQQDEVYEEEEQPPQPANRNAAYTSPFDKYPGSQISLLTDPQDALYKFELHLRCLKKDGDGNLIRIGGKNWKPMLNDVGLNKLISCMMPIVNPMVPLSNVDDHEVGILMRQLAYNLADAFMIHKETYGLTSMNRRMIAGEALEFCYIFLKRAYMEGDRKFFGKITQEIKSTQEVKNSRGGGSVLNPFNWGRKQM